MEDERGPGHKDFRPLSNSPVFFLLSPGKMLFTQNLYCSDGHLMELKCKYSNILSYWIFDSSALRYNHQNKKNFLNVLLYMY